MTLTYHTPDHDLVEYVAADGRRTVLPPDSPTLAALLAAGEDIAAYSPPPVDLAAELARLRWQRETGGITVDGIDLATDRDAQAMLTGAALASTLEGEGYEIRWKATSGWVTLSAGQVLALASAVRAHVQACFDAEAAVAALIDAGAVTTLEELLAAWASA